jgi:hypothetical protein
MNNGSGDEYSIVFAPAGAFVRGFDHESPMSPYGNDDFDVPGMDVSVPSRVVSVRPGTENGPLYLRSWRAMTTRWIWLVPS